MLVSTEESTITNFWVKAVIIPYPNINFISTDNKKIREIARQGPDTVKQILQKLLNCCVVNKCRDT